MRECRSREGRKRGVSCRTIPEGNKKLKGKKKREGSLAQLIEPIRL